MDSTIGATGKGYVRVYAPDGTLKQETPFKNIVTHEGDALIADLLSNTPVKTKVDNTNGYIPVGTGWTGTTPKNNQWVNTQVGTAKKMDAGYPQLKALWAEDNDNVVVYKVTYTPGLLNVNGINEAAITNGSLSGTGSDCLAYAEISPSVNMTVLDTLEIVWELSLLGA
jgi:hypothetical protein